MDKLPTLYVSNVNFPIRDSAQYVFAYLQQKFVDDIKFVLLAEVQPLLDALEKINTGFIPDPGEYESCVSEMRDVADEALKKFREGSDG